MTVDWGTYRSLCRRLFPLLCNAQAITRQQDTTAGPARRLLANVPIACCVQGAPCTPTKAIAGLQQHTGEGSPEDAGTSAGLGKIPPATLVWHEVTCDILDRASLKSKRVRALRRLTLPILRCSAVHGPLSNSCLNSAVTKAISSPTDSYMRSLGSIWLKLTNQACCCRCYLKPQAQPSLVRWWACLALQELASPHCSTSWQSARPVAGSQALCSAMAAASVQTLSDAVPTCLRLVVLGAARPAPVLVI